MSAFKDQISTDIHNIYFSLVNDEYISTHIIDGVEYDKVIVDEYEQIERTERLQQNTYKYGDGMFANQLLFYIPEDVYGKGLPATGRAMMFDGKRYLVADAISEEGIFAITLARKVN